VRFRTVLLPALILAGCAEHSETPPGMPEIPLPPPTADVDPARRPVLAAADVPSPARTRLSLPLCLGLAEAQSERLGAILEDVRIAEAQRALVRSGALPNLSANLEYRRQEDIGGTSSQNLAERRESRLTLQQPLFQGFKDLYAYRSATMGLEGSERTRDQTVLEVRTAVCEAYGRVLSLEQQKEAVASSLALAQARLEELEARLQAGLVRRTEVLSAEAQVARNQAQQTRLEGDCKDARSFLGFLIMEPALAPLEPFPSLDLPDLEHPERLSERALDRRQDLEALKRQEAAARETIRAEKAGHWPSVGLTANLYGKREGPSQDVDWDAALLGSLPLFEGGRTSARVRQAESVHRKAGLALRERRKRVLQQVHEAVSAYRTAKAVLDSLEREVSASRETEQLLQEEVRQGLAPQSEHLTAQDTLLSATVSLARQRIQERLSALALWTTLGEFPLSSTQHQTQEKPR